jgi:hypothetical protein
MKNIFILAKKPDIPQAERDRKNGLTPLIIRG